ncbi:protein takeout-like [Schistocerca americana]|uniref:protein takeout-like n=1 Tax=Schistocerca americana TaxID=7009 RepID=UPI001F4F9CA8|nr:protein takeout-like [Schistocerca americana]
MCYRSFPSERRLELDVWFPVLDMSFKYNVSGKVLVLPLDGAGTGTMKLENVTINYRINYETYRKGDTDYIKAAVAQSRGEIGHMALNLQNLFNGDKFLGVREREERGEQNVTPTPPAEQCTGHASSTRSVYSNFKSKEQTE